MQGCTDNNTTIIELPSVFYCRCVQAFTQVCWEIGSYFAHIHCQLTVTCQFRMYTQSIMSMHTERYARACARTHTHTHTQVHTHTHTHTRTHTHKHTHTQAHKHTHAHTHKLMYSIHVNVPTVCICTCNVCFRALSHAQLIGTHMTYI